MGSDMQRIPVPAGTAWAILAVLAGLAIFFVWPARQSDTPASTGSASRSERIEKTDDAMNHPHRSDGNVAAAPPSGTAAGRTTLPADVDRQTLDTARWTARGKHPLLNPDLVRIFEQLVGRAGEPHLALDGHVPPSHLAEAQRLLEKYRHYRQDLAGIATPDASRPAAEVLDAILTARLALQRKYFSESEIAGLFAEDNQYDRFTIERLRTAARTDLSGPQKEEVVAKSAQSLLTPEQREARETARLPARIAEQNALLDKAGATPRQRLDARSAEFGAEAAARMAEIDRQEVDWQERIARLAAADPATQQQMRTTLFTPQEQARLDGALALHRVRQGADAIRPHAPRP